ncbi:MAG: hypothetical protein CMO80_20945 [Verrucomicrobiales bacterium]|nr:hypothetical protein [Verrucomicrobiales bacterium]
MKKTFILAVALSAFLLKPSALVVAFPPAPHHLFYGTIRDEWGHPLTFSSATVIFETDTGVQVTTPLTPDVHPGINYKITIPMDSGFIGDPHKPTAQRHQVPFKIKVQIGSETLIPISMSGNFSTLGSPGHETRIDLTLGQDTDNDGLPDAWERELIRLSADPLINSLNDITAEGDLDGDGMTNAREYLVGTLAFDTTSGFSIEQFQVVDGKLSIQFLATRGRTYSIQGAVNLKQWQSFDFRLAEDAVDATLRSRYHSSAVRLLQLEVPISTLASSGLKFFRLRLH